MVNEVLLLDIKSNEKILTVQEAQFLTYLKLSKTKLDKLIKVNLELPKHGFRQK